MITDKQNTVRLSEIRKDFVKVYTELDEVKAGYFATLKVNILLSVFILGFGSLFAQIEKEQAVRNCFSKYKEAILTNNGPEAVQYVDSNTIAYYSMILEKTKEADSAEVAQLSFLDKMMVLTMRHRANEKELLSMTGNQLLIYAIEKGMVGKNTVANNSIGDVKVKGTTAKGQFLNNGQRTPIYFNFFNEFGEWRIDLTSIFEMSNAGLQRVVQQSGQTQEEFIFSILKKTTGKKVKSDVWQPVMK